MCHTGARPSPDGDETDAGQELSKEVALWQERPFQPNEPIINKQMGLVGSDANPLVRYAVLSGFWPTGTREHTCGRTLTVADRSIGADFAAVCGSCNAGPIHLAENKPRAANVHYKPVDASMWGRALRKRIIVPTWERLSPPGESCLQPHPWSEGCDAYSHKYVKNSKSLWRLALPQVVVDAVEHDLPVTIVTDAPNASVLYRTEREGFLLNDKVFPVMTPATLLDGIAKALPPLNEEERQQIRRAFTLFWARVGWEPAYRLSRKAKRFVEGWVDGAPYSRDGEARRDQEVVRIHSIERAFAWKPSARNVPAGATSPLPSVTG